MRVVHLPAIAAALSAAIVSPARAEDAAGLAPSSPWTVNYDDDSCALGRWFGEGDERSYLEIRRFGPGLGLQTTITSSKWDARNTGSFRYRFGKLDHWRDVKGALSMTWDNDVSGVLFELEIVDLPDLNDPLEHEIYLRSIDLKAIEREHAVPIDSITLRGAFGREVTLRLGSLDAPIGALQTCVDELITHWGIDVEAHKTLSRPTAPTNLREVPRMMDYPPKMLVRSMPGLVNIRLDIDETGQITACHIQMPLSDPVFEESSCADIQHALEFDPALDKDGKPIASYWITRVHFQIGT